ncbi:MAG: peroxiredoxin, partial [Isosphaeraceae bacterium]|nr:peroxiredoxin [Isosphaeraceae bacterium]
MKRTWWGILGVLGLGLVVASGARAAESAADLKVGDKAPEFSLPGTDGKTYTLADFKGKKAVILAWFPKAFTGGCTKECKSIRANSDSLKKLNIAYFTASVDEPDYNKKFAESLDLDYPILSDPSKKVAEAYGVVHSGRPVPERWTFYIDKEGIIKAIDKGVQKRTEQAGGDIAD